MCSARKRYAWYPRRVNADYRGIQKRWAWLCYVWYL
jgi:hypothetical protein